MDLLSQYFTNYSCTFTKKANCNASAGFNSVNWKGLGNSSLLRLDRWTAKGSKSSGNHPAFSFMNKRCGCIQRVTSWYQWSPELISTGKSPTELILPGSDPRWKQFIFRPRVSFIAKQHFTCALPFRFSSVPSWQRRTGIHSGSSTFLSSLRHKPLSTLGHKSYSNGSLTVRRQIKLLSARTGDPKTTHTQPMQVCLKANDVETDENSSEDRPNSSSCSWLAEEVDVIEDFTCRHGQGSQNRWQMDNSSVI